MLLVCSGIASGSETALFGLGRLTLGRFKNSELRLHRNVYRLMLHPKRVLLTVLLTNTAVNVGIFATSYLFLRDVEQASATLAAFGGVVILFAVIIIGEMIPKAVAFNNARVLSPFAGSLISTLQFVLGPILWVLGVFLVEPATRLLATSHGATDEVSSDELKLLVDQSARQGVITSLENQMLQAIITLGDASVREVMTPRVDIESVRLNESPDELRTRLRELPMRQFPVRGKDLDDIHGVLYVRSLHVYPNRALHQLLQPVHYVPEQIRLGKLIHHFREGHLRLAIVVDEYGGTTGLVTFRDVMEYLVGRFEEYDAEPDMPATEKIDDHTYRLAGDLSIRVWSELFQVREVGPSIDTLAGFILAKLGKMPAVGNVVTVANLTLTIERVRGRRIESVILHLGNFVDSDENKEGEA